MQEKLTIARPYASAAFSFATEAGDVAAWSNLLRSLGDAVDHEALKPLIGDPRVSKAQLGEILSEVLGNELNDKRSNFLNALLDAERLELAPEISELFERHKAASAGVVDVHVESAFDLTNDEREKIAQAVRARVGKDCEVTTATNPDLIGGAVIKVGDSVIDISLRGRLRALEQRLT